MNESALVEWFEDLHRHPEIGGQEFRTTGKIRDILSAHGVEILPADVPTGLIAIVRGGRPGRVIGLRADMDALPIQEESGLAYASCEPGKMHACGHDFHTTVMLGAAILLNEQRDSLAGTVKIVFQPAEENDNGGRMMVATGLLNDCQEFYAPHTYHRFPAGTLGIKEGPVMASVDRFAVRIRGKGAHAAQPHKGVDPIPAAASLVQNLQSIVTRGVDPFADAVLSVTHIEAGSTWNVVPETAFIEGTVRTLDDGVRGHIRQALIAMAQATAQAFGCRAEAKWESGSGPVINDAALCESARAVALEMGFTVDRQEDTMGGEDFSDYLAICPGVFVRVGTGGDYANHHPKFTADPAALWPAAQFFANLARSRAEIN